jgi:hypothetical protein
MMNNSRLSTANTSDGHWHGPGISPSTTLQENHLPDISRVAAQDTQSTPVSPTDKPDVKDTSVLVVDWDGPDDPKNPKK